MRLPWIAGLSAGGATLLLASGLLWLRFGERIYFDKMAAAIAGCF